MSDHVSSDSYHLSRMRATPYPNRLLERSIGLPETELRLLNLVTRASLGWQGKQPGTRKASAFFTVAQLQERTGRKTVASIIRALSSLHAQNILTFTHSNGAPVSLGRLAHHQALRLTIRPEFVEEAVEKLGDNVSQPRPNARSGIIVSDGDRNG